MPPSLSDKGFYEARKLLTQTTRVDALSCIHLAQRQVADALFRVGASDRIIRLSRSDIVETLMAKAARVICTDPMYATLDTPSKREAFVEAHLRIALMAWLGDHTKSAGELRSVAKARKLIEDPDA